MRPFRAAASSVSGNRRTPFTEAGGRRIGRKKDDPDKLWVDSYCRIQTSHGDYVMRAEIKRPGDYPIFELWNWSARNLVGRFGYDRLADALEAWKQSAIEAAEANAPTPGPS